MHTWLLLAFLTAQDSGTVLLSGEIDSEQSGQVRVELLATQGPGQNALLIWAGWAQGPGQYSLNVPSGLQSVMLRAALDLKRDGIGPDDPQIRVPIRLMIGQENLPNVNLLIRPPEHLSPSLPIVPREPEGG